MAKYVYGAIFRCADEGGYGIEFPDIEGCYTFGEDLYDGIKMAEDVLAMILADKQVSGGVMPAATDILEMQRNSSELIVPIACSTKKYVKRFRREDKKRRRDK